jgi:small ligand-binding sensory domain FIST
VFLTPGWFDVAAEALEVLRVHGRIPLLIGCSSPGLITNSDELEQTTGLVLGLFHLPGAKLSPTRIAGTQIEEAASAAWWHQVTGVTPDQTNGWLVFADPFHLDCQRWLNQWNEAYAPLPVLGGLASGDYPSPRTQLYLNGDVFEDGVVGLSVGGEVRLASVISQGCTPIGDTWTITRVDGNVILEIGNRPAYEVLMETVGELSPAEQRKLGGNLFVGLVIDEYLEEFHRGDFLIRNLIGADPNSGALAVGATPRAGQTIQFQRRDAAAATEDMAALLARAEAGLGGRPIYGGSLHCCNGRGQGLFGTPGHDARMIQERLGPFPLAGFFCNGELGPVGDRNFLHGYTASLALFVGNTPTAQG